MKFSFLSGKVSVKVSRPHNTAARYSLIVFEDTFYCMQLAAVVSVI